MCLCPMAGNTPQTESAAPFHRGGDTRSAGAGGDPSRGWVSALPAPALLPTRCSPETRAVNRAQCAGVRLEMDDVVGEGWPGGGGRQRAGGKNRFPPRKEPRMAGARRAGQGEGNGGARCAWRGTARTPAPAPPRQQDSAPLLRVPVQARRRGADLGEGVRGWI